ncbi:MAG TPA: phosphate ABC transporter permease subunit PstC [Parvibaculum sp.]|jgi:phosphate transport system permease protein
MTATDIAELNRLRRIKRAAMGDVVFKGLTWSFMILVLVILGGVIVVLVQGAAPALKLFGFDFLITAKWNPVTDQYGALVPLVGTLITSAIAILIGVPCAFAVAFFLTELCPYRLRAFLSVTVELLAAVPSIIYGIWGLFVAAPFFQSHVEPALANVLGPIPIIGQLFSGPAIGIGILLAGLILALMILPFITAVMRDVFESVPPVLRESAYALGATRWEVVWKVVLPYTRTGVVGAIMLGLGRALGETMAVTFVIGNSHRLPTSLFDPATTISAALANEFTEAVSDTYTSALIALGLVLFLLTFIVLAIGRRLLLRAERSKGGGK